MLTLPVYFMGDPSMACACTCAHDPAPSSINAPDSHPMLNVVDDCSYQFRLLLCV